MEYPLSALLAVRGLHEENAKQALRRAKAELDAARLLAQERHRELNAYRQWREEEEERRYQAILNSRLRLSEVSAFSASMASLSEKEAALGQALERAVEQTREAEAAVAARREELFLARKESLKLAAHKDSWTAEQALRETRHAERELEEFTDSHCNGRQA